MRRPASSIGSALVLALGGLASAGLASTGLAGCSVSDTLTPPVDVGTSGSISKPLTGEDMQTAMRQNEDVPAVRIARCVSKRRNRPTPPIRNRNSRPSHKIRWKTRRKPCKTAIILLPLSLWTGSPAASKAGSSPNGNRTGCRNRPGHRSANRRLKNRPLSRRKPMRRPPPPPRPHLHSKPRLHRLAMQDRTRSGSCPSSARQLRP